MIKKLLNKINSIFLLEKNSKKIEKYLAQSKDLIDLEQKMCELDRNGTYNKLYF